MLQQHSFTTLQFHEMDWLISFQVVKVYFILHTTDSVKVYQGYHVVIGCIILSLFYVDTLNPDLHYYLRIFVSRECHVCRNILNRYELFFKKCSGRFSLFSKKIVKSLSHSLFFIINKVKFASISTKNISYHCNIFKEGIPLKFTFLTYKYFILLIITCKFVQPMFKYRPLSSTLITILPMFQYGINI